MAAKIQPGELLDAATTYAERHPGVAISQSGGTITLSDANGKGCTIGPGLEGSDEAVVAELRDIVLSCRMDQGSSSAQKTALKVPGQGNIHPTTGKAITAQDIINYVNPKATEAEAYLFAEFCRRKGADPMTKQVYLVIYEGQGGRQVNFIAGKEYFTEKAEAHPLFDGMEAGILVRPKDGGDLIRRPGTFYEVDQETLLGGWARVHRKDRKIETFSEVAFRDFDTKKNLWAKMPAVMIRKVALVQALREAFPANFGGMYDASELEART